MIEGGERRLALAVLGKAVHDYRRSENALYRGSLREWVESPDGEFYCDIAEVTPGRVLTAMSKPKRVDVNGRSVAECHPGRPHWGRGMCKRCYHKWYRERYSH